MKFTRIKTATPLPGFRLRLKLTDGRVIERAVRRWMNGPVFAEGSRNPEMFAAVRVEHGTVAWPVRTTGRTIASTCARRKPEPANSEKAGPRPIPSSRRRKGCSRGSLM
jgi:hypothetical protein